MTKFPAAASSAVLLLAAACAMGTPAWAASDPTKPIVDDQVVFGANTDGVIAVEAEHFFKQENTDTRAWYLTTTQMDADAHGIKPDIDGNHANSASGGAYLEVLPDNRWTHGEPLIGGENFANLPVDGLLMCVLSYKVKFEEPGRYYVWARIFSTGAEDNGLHVGINDTWPESGHRLQWTGKREWRWDTKRRTEEVPTGVDHMVWIDVPSAGVHTIQFAMREDGAEFDKFFLTPVHKAPHPGASAGPEPTVVSGATPAAFPVNPALKVVEIAPPSKPVVVTDTTPFEAPVSAAGPDGRPLNELSIAAKDFHLDGTGFYNDREGRWAAVDPEQQRSAKADADFPFPSGKYKVQLHAVGENDGQSSYKVWINGDFLGDYTALLDTESMVESDKYINTFDVAEVNTGDVITVQANIGSADGKEFSRARWARLVFVPADATTESAVKSVREELAKMRAQGD